MKCQNCGANLNLEDRFCSYCGEPNPFAVRHQEQMERYEKDYRETRKAVLEQSSRFNRRTVNITVIAVLTALIALCGLLYARADDIRWWKMERAVASQAEVHRQELDRLMEARDYPALNSYCRRNRIDYSDALREYDAVSDMTYRYMSFYDELMTLQGKRADSGAFQYISESELTERIAVSIYSVYEAMEPRVYNAEAFQGERMAYMEDLRDHMEIMVSGYFGISPEEAAGMRDMTQTRIAVLLEESDEK